MPVSCKTSTEDTVLFNFCTRVGWNAVMLDNEEKSNLWARKHKLL